MVRAPADLQLPLPVAMAAHADAAQPMVLDQPQADAADAAQPEDERQPEGDERKHCTWWEGLKVFEHEAYSCAECGEGKAFLTFLILFKTKHFDSLKIFEI